MFNPAETRAPENAYACTAGAWVGGVVVVVVVYLFTY